MKNNYLNVILISGSGLIGGLINYAYHPIMLNYLSLKEFGDFGSLVGIFNILGILVAGLSLFLTKEVAKNINNKNKVKHIFIESTKILAIIGIISYLFFVLFSPIISNFLKVDLKLINITGTIIIFSFFGASISSSLVGLKKFSFLGIINIIIPILKLIIGFGLSYLGYSVYGAIFGFILSGLLGFIISYIYIINYLKNYENTGNTKELLNDLHKNKLSILNFFLVNVFFAFIMNIDVILAKNIFDSDLAGIYAGISVVGKFLIFLLLSIETVYYGQIMEYKKENIPRNLIRNPLVLIVLSGFLAVFINYFLGGLILGILKPELVKYTNIYLLLIVYYCLIVILSFLSKVLIGWEKYKVNYIMFFISILLIFLVYLFGLNSLENFIYVFISTIIFGVFLVGGLFYYEMRR